MSGPAMYKQLADLYRQKILTGSLRPGDLIPSQTELAKLHGISVVTVRNALSILVDEGLVSRVRRKGTFVEDPKKPSGSTTHAMKRVYFMYNDLPIRSLYAGVHRLMMDGIAKECANQGLDLALHNCHNDFRIPGSKEDGYLLWGFSAKLMQAAMEWSQQGYRLVALHNFFPHISVPRVNSDNYTGGYMATHHLLMLGHRRIGVILPSRCEIIEVDLEFTFRLAGYHSALSHFDVASDADLVRVITRGYDEEYLAEAAMRELMELRDPPTAVFVATDAAAVGALSAVQSLGYRVPEEVSIVGYDGLAFADHTNPKLTTVNQGFYHIGMKGVERLCQTDSGPIESLVRPSLIVRESTGALVEQEQRAKNTSDFTSQPSASVPAST